jgi:hypothetical protein
MGNGAIDSTSFIEILKVSIISVHLTCYFRAISNICCDKAAHFVGTSVLQKMDEVLHKERKMGILGVNKLGFFA